MTVSVAPEGTKKAPEVDNVLPFTDPLERSSKEIVDSAMGGMGAMVLRVMTLLAATALLVASAIATMKKLFHKVKSGGR